MQNNKRVYLVLAIFLLVLPFTMAIGNISILDTYYEYYGWIDFALYLLIFIGITQELMNLKFKKGVFGTGELSQGTKAVSVGLGLALAISLATWEVKAGFYLFKLGPLILLIIALLIILWVAGWLKSRDKTGVGLSELRNAAIYFIIFMLILYFFFPSLIYTYLPWSWINNLFGILVIIAIVILLISLGKHRESSGSPGRGLLGRTWDGAKKAANWLGDKKRKTDAEYERLQDEIDRDRNRAAQERTRKAQEAAERAAQEKERRRYIDIGRAREKVLRGIQ